MKLEGILNSLKIDVSGKVCLDIGASTGGFTHCLLLRGASKVYAVDIGTNQLNENLKKDSRIINLEQTDIRKLDRNRIPEEINIIVVDVSFISVKKIISDIRRFASDKTIIIVLIKPQFEVGKEFAQKGVVKDRDRIKQAIKSVQKSFENENMITQKVLPCELKGKTGNQEYFGVFNLLP